MPEEEAQAIAQRLNMVLWWYAESPGLWEDYSVASQAMSLAIALLAEWGYHLVYIGRLGFYGYRATKKGL